jgi:hypothetical protein
MRSFLQNKRGQVRVIEAFFASILMLSALTLITPAFQHLSSGSNSVLSAMALNVLTSLDGNGHLSRLLDQKNWTAIQSCVEALVAPAVWFNLTVYDKNMIPINNTPICNSGAISDHIEAADYLCVSMSGTYAVYNLRLQLAGLD